MRRAAFFGVFVLLMASICGCSNNAETVSYDDLINGEIDSGTEVNVTGTVAHLNEANKNKAELDLEGPTQIVSVVDENSKDYKVYNELDITEEKIEKDDKVTIKGVYYDTKETSIPVIQSKEIDKN